nr:ribonuclease H-like domain-containing protein [Tanacetum cinerariifolium]
MWLFKHNFHDDGTLSRYKARLVANGSSQQLSIDFDETFSPVVKPATIRTVLSLVVSRQWPIHQLGVKNAFLNGDLSKIMYMHQGSCFVDSRYPRHVSPLGLDFLIVDIIDSLHKEFDMTDLGELNYFIGISAARHSTWLFSSQKNYALQLLERALMVNCNMSPTPVNFKAKLGPNGVHVQNPNLYRSLAREGATISYLYSSRFDLCSSSDCLYMHDPREPHFASRKRIMRYIQGTIEFGLHLYASAITSLVGYTVTPPNEACTEYISEGVTSLHTSHKIK